MHVVKKKRTEHLMFELYILLHHNIIRFCRRRDLSLEDSGALVDSVKVGRAGVDVLSLKDSCALVDSVEGGRAGVDVLSLEDSGALVDSVEGGRAGVKGSGSDVTARINPFGLSFFLLSFPPAFCFYFLLSCMCEI